jgi:hypothetical protein
MNDRENNEHQSDSNEWFAPKRKSIHREVIHNNRNQVFDELCRELNIELKSMVLRMNAFTRQIRRQQIISQIVEGFGIMCD